LPVVTDLAVAEKEVELAILSAMAHGNGPQGLEVLAVAFGALGRLDQDHAAVYFQVIWNVLRGPMRQALETLVMERQIEGKPTFPPFAQQLIDRGFREGELTTQRNTLLRLLARAGIALTEEDRARIEACADPATLDQWIDNILGAKTAAEVLT
jgi:hypothetical protein